LISIDTRGVPLDLLLEKEWLEVNGRGGYASGTLVHCHTRKYHGLMVVNLERPPGRYILVSKFEELLHHGAEEFYLSMHKYPLVYSPAGPTGLVEFVLDLHPHFTFRFGDGIVMEKEVLFIYGEDTLLVRYVLREAPGSLRFTVKPFIACRNIHELSKENRFLRTRTEAMENGFTIAPYDGMPHLFLQTSTASTFHPLPNWYRNFEYLRERDRGFSYHEDLFMPGIIECEMSQGSEIIIRASMREDPRSISRLWEQELSRRKWFAGSLAGDGGNDPQSRQHAISAGDFIVRDRNNRLSHIAGYHWFYEWGRDTVISVPGLMFSTGRVEEGVEILRNLVAQRMHGLIPNTVAEYDEAPSYNSVDASLWFFWAVQEYLKHTGDMSVVRDHFWPAMLDIIHHYYHGTSGLMRVHENGLLDVGDESTQLTWMDARAHGIPVTPRHGCPVEITDLWFNALSSVGELRREFGGELTFDLDDTTCRLKEAFLDHFWIPGGHYLADVWLPGPGTRDESVRPNQIFAVSLPCSIVDDPARAACIVKKVTDELLTPWGLRTLSPADPRYRASYRGAPDERDSAYHQGTVWPWLLGHYGDALMKTASDNGAARKALSGILSGMERHMEEAGLGHISEIFSGDPPHEPCGCIAQAWSLAEILRLRALLER
jgi:predicted glycogen debranching enzyme